MAEIYAENQINLNVIDEADVNHFYYDELGAHVDAENGNKTTVDANGTHIFKDGNLLADYGNDINLYNGTTGDVAFHVGTADNETENAIVQSTTLEDAITINIYGEKVGTTIVVTLRMSDTMRAGVQFTAGTSETKTATRNFYTATYTYGADGSTIEIVRGDLAGVQPITVKYTKLGYASQCTVNGSINADLGYTVGDHSSPIGTLSEIATNDRSIARNTWTQGSNTLTLDPGTWVIFGNVEIPTTSTTATRKGIRIVGGGASVGVSEQVVTSSSAGIVKLSTSCPVTITEQTTYNTQVYHNYTSALTCTNEIKAVRIA